jgi:hypothetical protein
MVIRQSSCWNGRGVRKRCEGRRQATSPRRRPQTWIRRLPMALLRPQVLGPLGKTYSGSSGYKRRSPQGACHHQAGIRWELACRESILTLHRPVPVAARLLAGQVRSAGSAHELFTGRATLCTTGLGPLAGDGMVNARSPWLEGKPGHADQRRREHHRCSRPESRHLYAIRRALGMTARFFSYAGHAKEARTGILRAASRKSRRVWRSMP